MTDDATKQVLWLVQGGVAAVLTCFTGGKLPFVGKSDSNQFDHDEDDDGDNEAGGDDDDDDDDDDDGYDDFRGLVCTCVDTVYVSRGIFVWCYVFRAGPSSGVPFVRYHLVSHPMLISNVWVLRLLNTNWTGHPFVPQTKQTRASGLAPINIHIHVLYIAVDMHICFDLRFSCSVRNVRSKLSVHEALQETDADVFIPSSTQP